VCKTWHAAVGQMQHDRVWFLSYVRNAELWVAQAPLRVQAMHAMHASCLEAYAKEVFTASGFGALAQCSEGFSLDLADLKQQYEDVVHSMVLGLTENALHKNAQVVGMRQLHKLCQLILLSDAFCFYDPIPVLSTALEAVVTALETHRGAEAQERSLMLLNKFYRIGMRPSRATCSQLMHAMPQTMAAHAGEPDLLWHACKALVNFGQALDAGANARCTVAVLSLLQGHTDIVQHVALEALVTLYKEQTRKQPGFVPVHQVEQVLLAMQPHATVVVTTPQTPEEWDEHSCNILLYGLDIMCIVLLCLDGDPAQTCAYQKAVVVLPAFGVVCAAYAALTQPDLCSWNDCLHQEKYKELMRLARHAGWHAGTLERWNAAAKCFGVRDWG